MKSPSCNTSARGTTLLELLFVVLIIGILALLILPVIGKAKARAKRAACVNNLHQIGIAHHVFAHDHGDQFTFQVATNDGGTLEFARAGFTMDGEFYFAFRHFQALSNTLDLTRLLVCPADTRTNAEHFAALRNLNLSYFVGVNAEYTRPASILAGDRNISGEGFASGSILRLSPGSAQWSSGSHEYKGNLLFADGHVEQSDNEVLGSTIQSAGMPPSSLLPPITPPGGGEGPIVSEPIVVATLQRFFDTAPATQGAAGNSGATPNAIPTAPATPSEARPASVPKPTAPATPPEARPANDPKPTAPAPAMAARRPDARPDANTATNPSPAVAAQEAARQAGRASKALPSGTTDAGASTDNQFNFYFFLFEPGRHFGGWFMVLLVVVLAAFGLGWHVQRSRAKRRLATAGPASRGA